MNTIPAIYEQGVFRPTVPVQLPEGTKVDILTPSPPKRAASDDARQRFLELIGSVDTGAPLGTANEEIDRDLAREYGNGK